MNKAHLYINSKGYYVTRHSYSGSDAFNFCARKYYLERVQGWSEKEEGAAKYFGIAVEQAVQFYHQRGMNVTAAVAEFHRLWNESKDKPYKYNKTDLDWNRLNLSGEEMVRLYAVKYPTFPYNIPNPQDSFQVETNFEVFPATKLAGLEFTSYFDIVAEIKETGEPLIIDEKTSGKDIPELTVLDPQLRSYSWVKNCPNVAFLWFRKCGRTISKGDKVTLLEPRGGHAAGTDLLVLGKNGLDEWVLTSSPKVFDEMDEKFVGEKKDVKAGRQYYIEANGFVVPESAFTKQQVLFKMVVITPESAEDIGRSIKRDMIAIAQATEKDFFPMQSGVRYPNEKCPNCPMRGICANKPELRDMLLARKQVDELEFGKESE